MTKGAKEIKPQMQYEDDLLVEYAAVVTVDFETMSRALKPQVSCDVIFDHISLFIARGSKI